jgi:protein-L-isoaspartate(D-aspartate) O-methyltransferase
MRQVRRELFVPPAQRSRAEADTALPIGWDQTISQPSLVAFMTEQLELEPGTRVLEIGTGSGYQTAILAELAKDVFTIERLAELSIMAEERLEGLGYRNIRFRTGDGALGWPEEGPFEAVIVTAAAETLPPPLIEQLARGGRLVAPVGSTALDNQVLVRVEKHRDGMISQRELCQVRFVPLISDAQHRK